MSESGGGGMPPKPDRPTGRPRTGFDPGAQRTRPTPVVNQQPPVVNDAQRGGLTRRPVQRQLQPVQDPNQPQVGTQLDPDDAVDPQTSSNIIVPSNTTQNNDTPRRGGWGGQRDRPTQTQGGGFSLANARGQRGLEPKQDPPKRKEKEPPKIDMDFDDDSLESVEEKKRRRSKVSESDEDDRPRKVVPQDSENEDSESPKIKAEQGDGSDSGEDDGNGTGQHSNTTTTSQAWGGVRAPTRPAQKPFGLSGARTQPNNTNRPTTQPNNTNNQQQPVVQQPQLDRKEGSLKLKDIDKLPPEQRLWSDNVLRALNIKSKGSQARVVAGAIASAEMVMQTGNDRDKLAAKTHRQTVIDAGPPPWKQATDAMNATNAKVQLDLLSIPPNQRQLKRLDAISDNKTYWINQVGPDGGKGKSFLCKPATRDDGEPKVSGGPKGGEVAREALAGRAAQILQGQTGIDIGMPETHVVKLDDQFLPDGAGDGSSVSCSVQEARPANGDLRGKTGAALAQLDPDQVAGIAIYDTITLNTDRHAGNVLTGTDGNLVPIDHGESFAEPSKAGLARVALAVGGPHNALLQIPCAHDPMSSTMRKQLKGLDPEAFANSLAKDRDQVSEVHPDMAGMISDDAIEAARRSAEFTKLAAKNQPPLSPAAIQVALGGYAKELLDLGQLDGKAFTRRAKDVIARTALAKDAIKDICTASDAEYDVLCKQVETLGWRVQDRNTQPAPDCVTDPVMMMSIVQNQIRFKKQAELKMPKRAAQDASDAEKEEAEQARAQARADYAAEGAAYIDSVRAAFDPSTASDCMDSVTQKALGQLLNFLAPNDVADAKQRLRAVASQPRNEQKPAYRALCAEMGAAAFDYQKQRFDAIEATHQLAQLRRADLLLAGRKSYQDAAVAAGYGNALALAPDVNDLDTIANRDGFIPLAVVSLTKEITILGGKFTIPDDDADLVAMDTALQTRDPAEGYTCYIRLLTRSQKGEFPTKAQATKVEEKTDGT